MANYYIGILFLILIIIALVIAYNMSCMGNNCNGISKTSRTPRTPRTPKSVEFTDSKAVIIKAVVQNQSGQNLQKYSYQK